MIRVILSSVIRILEVLFLSFQIYSVRKVKAIERKLIFNDKEKVRKFVRE